MEQNGQNDRDGTQNGPGEQIRAQDDQRQQVQQSQNQQSGQQEQSQPGAQQGKTADERPARGPDGNGQNAGGGVAELEIEKLGGIGEGQQGELGGERGQTGEQQAATDRDPGAPTPDGATNEPHGDR